MARNATQSSGGVNEIGDQKKQIARLCARESMAAGAKTAAFASVATAIPFFARLKMMPWTRSCLNPVAQTLLFWTVAGGTFFIAADNTARRARFPNAVITNGIQT